jgi:nucleotide sugar dehydrogenase
MDGWSFSDELAAECDALPIVSVQGLGFVGAAMAVAIASARDAKHRPAYRVVGVDLPTEEGLSRIQSLNRGIFPFVTTDDKIREKTRQAHAVGNLIACADPAAFAAASTIVVDVPLDVAWRDGQAALELEPFRCAITSIGQRMRPDALVVIETTVPPGATARIAAPILKQELARRGLPTGQFKLAHSYERVTPGATYFDSIVNMLRVYSGCDTPSAEACEAFLRSIIDTDRYPLTRLPNTTASELAKVLENTFRAVTIALMEEWSVFAEAIGVDLFEVVDSIRLRPTHSNMRTPGFGVGGYCLTKDPLMGQLAASEIFGVDYAFPFASLALATNSAMPRRIVEKVRQLLHGTLQGKRLLLLGISYRQDVSDTRFSPSEIFYKAAREAGAEVLLHDPLVEYWREQAVPISRHLPPASELDAVVLAVPHREYANFDFAAWVGAQHPLFLDAVGVLGSAQQRRLRALGCPVESVGRGAPNYPPELPS